ncbi:hypothetical protein KKG65_02110 [Patescibacteria group bacterium]|nr:hypothetical protein [Patescibacteria group bacterium]
MVARILVAENDVDVDSGQAPAERDSGRMTKELGFETKNIWTLEVPENGVKISELKKWLKINHLSVKSGELMVFWIKGADNLSEQCQNVLLKPLEEARDEVLFVLTVENESGLLPTIVSRCNVRKLGPSRSHLEGERGYWEELVEAWRLGPGASIALLDKWEKDKEMEILNILIKKLAKGLREFPSIKRVKILQLALELKKDARLMVNRKLLLGRFLLEGWKISGL